MGVLQRFERKLEGAVGGAFARLFKGRVHPAENDIRSFALGHLDGRVHNQPGKRETLEETIFRVTRIENTLAELKTFVQNGNSKIATLAAKPQADLTDEDIQTMTDSLIAAFGTDLAGRVASDLAARLTA